MPNWLRRWLYRLLDVERRMADLEDECSRLSGAHATIYAQAEQWERKAKHSKLHILDLRYAIKGAVISMRDLAERSVDGVTPQHLADLAAEADKLVQYTDLPA